ncbi:MAG: site-specific DNA-methyltransferase [Alphaproteobacteria bacterium]|jgi:site-specific DNA-methyltransferase (adenine-specific)|nr:site-specific DNA-methyltransferase [Alphaproteobacteria bacterium]
MDKIEKNSIDLIYLDPPFFSQKEYKVKRDNIEYKFNDSWEDISEYIDFLEIRIKKMKDILKDTGSIFIHCDNNASHYIKVLLDNIFGYNNFRNEIIWNYKKWSNSKKGLINNHQTIFFYSKTNKYKFFKQYKGYSETTNVDQILNNRMRDKDNKVIYSEEIAKKKNGVPLGDVWDIPFLNPKAKERVNYPTQKPIHLLEKIIELCSEEGDVILDPFCGSGTTLVASKILNRNYIGIDMSQDAIDLSDKRLKNPIKTESQLCKASNNKQNSFEFKEDNNINKRNIISNLSGHIVHRNSGIDGFLNSEDGLIAIKIKDDGESFEKSFKKLEQSTEKKKIDRKAIVIIGEVENNE